MDLDRRVGPLSGRAWGLVLNFGFNALALYGLSRVLREQPGWVALAVGTLGTLACLVVVARPSK